MKLKIKHPRGKRKKRSRNKIRLQVGRSMASIKREVEREKFGK